MRPGDLLMVAGDHGMTASGNHGGDSVLELDAALLVYPSRAKLSTRVPNATVHADPRMAQIDLVPTLACLTGVPIPYSNLGVLVHELVPFEETYRACLVENMVQVGGSAVLFY
ncbi:unnamed protein product [Echinostoma caproni]|uniref:N(1)-alpha-phosphoribosyltransferase n=1 Tax=Echinostoma caproni TaxID=27848 RepID=A0A183BAV6_9TREM|nr:unnamed protein product [Echinostoma caproni]